MAAPGSQSRPSGVLVRRARLEDGPRARALLQQTDELHASLAPGYFRAGPRATAEWRHLVEDPTGAVLVATGEQGEVALGLVVVRIYDTPDDPTMVPRRRGHIETLAVDPGHRRRGIGRRLMDEAATFASAQGAVELVLTTWAGNDSAEAFYRRLGYRTLSRVLSRALPSTERDAGQAAAGGRRVAFADRDQTR